ncbi:MAG: metal-dependent transcriptional regulator [Chloroflexota bacterium]|nr:metal-dependent transcriptional regulator [Chloroflexota bacterium]
MPKSNNETTSTTVSGTDLTDERHSPVTENYLLSLYKLLEDSDFPTVTQLTDNLKQLPLTEGLGTSVPSVAGMVRRMEKQGLVDVGSDKKIRLTTSGIKGGEDIARRHRLAEWLVVSLLGMDLHQAYVEAHQLEHGMSHDFETKLTECLGHPKKSPFGRPIPGTGEPYSPPGALNLGRAVTDSEYLVERIPEEDVDLLRFLDEWKITPGRKLSVLETAPYRGVLTIKTARGEVSLGYNVAEQILVLQQ